MQTYIVTGPGSVWNGGKICMPGAELELTEADAASLGDQVYLRGTAPPKRDPMGDMSCVGGGLDIGLVKDATGLVIVARNAGQYSVREAIGFKRKLGADALSLENLCPRICEICLRHGVRTLFADGHEFSETQRHCAKGGVTLERFPGGPEDKLAAWAFARNALTDGHLLIPSTARQLKKELRSTGHRLTPGGRIEIIQPRKSGTHGDLASAFVLALYGAQHAQHFDPSEIARLNADLGAACRWGSYPFAGGFG